MLRLSLLLLLLLVVLLLLPQLVLCLQLIRMYRACRPVTAFLTRPGVRIIFLVVLLLRQPSNFCTPLWRRRR
jgi:hypothetical protein